MDRNGSGVRRGARREGAIEGAVRAALNGAASVRYANNGYFKSEIHHGHPHDRKTRTRKRILEAATRIFAAKGFEAGAIEDVMLECGLTRGGFYAHFRSKAHLYQEAVAELDPTVDWPVALFKACRQEPHASAWSFLAIDAASIQPVVREHYTRFIERMHAQMRSYLGPKAADEAAALAATAMAVGSLVIAQSVSDSEFSARVATSCEKAIRAFLLGDMAADAESVFPRASEAYLQAVGDARGEAVAVVVQPTPFFWGPASAGAAYPGKLETLH